MRKPLSECLDCKDRKAGCHSTCEKYKKFKEELEVYKKKFMEDNTTEWLADTRPWMHRK